MALPAIIVARYTPEEYLALERAAEFKSEYIDGEIVAMSGASHEHSLTATNIAGELRQRLKGRHCEVHSSDMRVKVADTGLYTYPDATVVCGTAEFEDDNLDILVNPTVVFEVLSRTTEAYDRGEKFASYRRVASLQVYVLVAQDRPWVERYTRLGAEWVLTEFSSLDATVDLPSIGCDLPLQEIYDKVPLGPAG